MIKEDLWCFLDGEYYTGEFATEKECIEEFKAYNPDEPEMTIGQTKHCLPKVCSYSICDWVGDAAYDRVGDVAEGWLSLSNEEHEELTKVLTNAFYNWVIVNGHAPNFYEIKNEKRVKLHD